MHRDHELGASGCGARQRLGPPQSAAAFPGRRREGKRQETGAVHNLGANAPASWSAAGSEAPRRFGWCGRVARPLGASTAVRRRSKAPSPLRSAGALQTRADLHRPIQVAESGDLMLHRNIMNKESRLPILTILAWAGVALAAVAREPVLRSEANV